MELQIWIDICFLIHGESTKVTLDDHLLLGPYYVDRQHHREEMRTDELGMPFAISVNSQVDVTKTDSKDQV